MAMTKGSKWDAAESMLSLLLKAPERYCDVCGEMYDEKFFPCCQDPMIGTHKEHLADLVRCLTEFKKMNLNEFGASKSGNMRMCLTMPRKLLAEWSRMFEKQHGEKLFRSDDKKLYKVDVRNAMRRFPFLSRADKV